jgi:hypothetical protein
MWPFSSDKQQLDELKQLCRLVVASQTSLAETQVFFYKNITKRLDGLERKLDAVLRRLGPGRLSIHVLGELQMSDKLSFVVYLPEKAAPDVVSRELTVTIKGKTEDVEVITLDADASEVPALLGAEGDTVTLSLVDIDNAGLRSEPSVLKAVLADTFPPPKPGVLGLEITGEVFSNGLASQDSAE